MRQTTLQDFQRAHACLVQAGPSSGPRGTAYRVAGMSDVRLGRRDVSAHLHRPKQAHLGRGVLIGRQVVNRPPASTAVMSGRQPHA
jgi:hypothetical protein